LTGGFEMGYTESSVKRAVDPSGDDILTFQKDTGEHIQAVAHVPVQDVNDLEEVGAITYIGIEDANAEWIIKKLDETSGISIRYATVSNNGGYSTYSDAWAARASLSYDLYSALF
jgi:hypothetical protein